MERERGKGGRRGVLGLFLVICSYKVHSKDVFDQRIFYLFDHFPFCSSVHITICGI